jgi:GT2 family glycosyltransferase
VISVAVCTRNRASQLERCLRSMMTMDRDVEWQLVVVDNGSCDDTKAVIERAAKWLPVTYVWEGKRGLSQARNRAIAASRYSLIAFTDDDCLPAQDWLIAVIRSFACDPALAILGGRVEPAGAGDPSVASRVHRHSERVSTAEQMIALMIGCNMSFRRDVFDTVGLFDAALGKGTAVGSAEDIDLMYRALREGLKLAYSPDVMVYHAHGRNTATDIESVSRDYVRGRGAFYWKFIGDRPIQRIAYWEVRGLLKGLVRRAQLSSSSAVLGSLAAGALHRGVADVAQHVKRRLN